MVVFCSTYYDQILTYLLKYIYIRIHLWNYYRVTAYRNSIRDRKIYFSMPKKAEYILATGCIPQRLIQLPCAERRVEY